MKKTVIIFHLATAFFFVIYQIFKHDFIVLIKTNLPLGALLIFGIFDICIYFFIGIVIILSAVHVLKRMKIEKWKAFFPFMLWMIAIVFVLFFAKNEKIEKITCYEATDIGKSYFLEQYGKNVTVEEINDERIQYTRRNVITVCDGETEYMLYLDEKNRPSFDNVLAVDIQTNIDIESVKEMAKILGLEFFADYNVTIVNSYDKQSCFVRLCVTTKDRLHKEKSDAYYSFLVFLRDKGITELLIDVNSPDFLLSKKEFDHRVNIGIGKEVFDTNMGTKEFRSRFNIFSDSIFWDKQKFESKLSELNRMGYENPCFFVSQWRDYNTLEIVLCCEGGPDNSVKQDDALFADMDESYINIQNVDIVYVLKYSSQ